MNDKTVSQLMVPKDRMTILDMHVSLKEISRVILKTGYSRFPIRKGDDFDIVGFIHAKDVFRLMEGKKPHSLKTIVRLSYFVPRDGKIDAQLRSFQKEKLHQAVVLDNEGRVIGLVTLEDILEELVGSIQDEHDLGI
jgi:CBS domain containing-hemolysin-like protein